MWVDDVVLGGEVGLAEQEAIGRLVMNYLKRVVFPVFALDGADRPSMGTGLFVEVDGAEVLVTAAHNFEGATAFGIGTDEAWNDQSTVQWLPECDVHFVGGERKDAHDVAIVRAVPGTAARLGLEALPLAMVGLGELLPSEPVIVHGYPAELADLEESPWRVRPVALTYMTHAVPWEAFPEGSERWRHHLLRYDRYNADQLTTGGRLERELPAPGGISGCGVWSVRASERGLFSYQNLRLHGIEYAIRGPRPGEGVLVCNTSVALVDLVAGAFPDLRPVVEAWRGR